MEAKRRSLQLQPLHLLTASSPPPSPVPRRQSSISIPFRPERAVVREPLTLVEKHADLLHFIAQKESKCLELRSQLAVHEAELLELKRKWERIVSRGFERQQSTAAATTPVTTAPPTPPPQRVHHPVVTTPTTPAFDDISSWITTNIPKKWDTATISKRASMFGQSIAQALDLGAENVGRPLTSPPLKPSLSRAASARSSLGRRASRLNTSHSPSTSTSTTSSTLTDSPTTSSPPSSPPSNPATPTTSKQPASRSGMSLTRTPEEDDEDEAWNW